MPVCFNYFIKIFDCGLGDPGERNLLCEVDFLLTVGSRYYIINRTTAIRLRTPRHPAPRGKT